MKSENPTNKQMPTFAPNQREQEKRDFESKLAASLIRKLEMEYSLENQDPPNPDILVPIPNIGIELIRYIRKSDSVKDEGALSKLIRNAEEKYREQGGKLNAHIWLWPSAILNFHKQSRIQIESLSGEIANFALSNSVGDFDFGDARNKPFNGIIKRIELFDDEFRKYWQIPRAGIISFFPDIITNAIISKEQKIRNYTRKFNEIWLLIHSTSGCCIGSPNSQDMFASTFKIEDDAKAIKHSGKFDRVFLLDFFGDILELDKE